MKNNPLTTILIGALALSAVWSVILCLQYVSNTRELRTMQGQALNINNRQMTAQAILNEAIEYGKKNPAIEPLLESVGIKKSAAAPAAKPATR